MIYIVAGVVVSILSLLLSILSSLLLFVLQLSLLSLSLYLHYHYIYLFYLYFNVIVVARILPIFIIKVELCTIFALTTLYLALYGFQNEAKFVQRNIVN